MSNAGGSDVNAFGGLRGRLRAPGAIYVAQMLIPEPAIASILGMCAFDFVFMDVEHGPFTLSSLRACVEAFASTPAAPVVRTASDSPTEINQLLDLGVEGVIVPKVETREQAAAIVSAARYPPEGTRGVSRVVRSARYGFDSAYVETANSNVAVFAIVESALGVHNVEEIVAVPGLDGVFVGADDLSADLGLFGRYEDGRVRQAVDEIVAATRSAGLRICGGYGPPAPEEEDLTIQHCFLDAIGLASAARESLEARKTRA